MISSMVDIPCEGLLIDADLARHLHLPELSGGPISGTLAFISRRLHRQFVNGHPVQHTSSDDLESSIWVILWELYCQSEELGPSCSCLDENQRSVYDGLRGDSNQMLKAKETFNTYYDVPNAPTCGR
ncbi:hypothetical protein DL93DRAFT_1571512 [Clavulina sp. PMI_390]|nr:hypothetical protein DL93DRAFT_1571512 [Clavulina sp. PMI_390]